MEDTIEQAAGDLAAQALRAGDLWSIIERAQRGDRAEALETLTVLAEFDRSRLAAMLLCTLAPDTGEFR